VVESVTDDLGRQRQLLSNILKQIRTMRRMTARAVSAAMDMPLRSYYSFESGQGALDLTKLWRFADATDSDPFAIVIALVVGSPDYALRSMDNKAASILLASLKHFNDRVGDRMVHVGSAAFIEAFKRQFDSLEEHLAKRDQSTERWLAENLLKIVPPE